jgi:Raf kinase inhibitor-like YbhB/YbcL family protein
MRNSILPPALLLSLIAVTATPPRASADTPDRGTRADRGAKSTLTVTSSAFSQNEAIPSEYTCDGAEKTPPLSWSGVPSDAKSVAILVDDPDAPKGTFTHWLITNLPPNETSLSENGSLPQGAMAAKNGKGATGYTAPCPPTGSHHYHFRVYALDKTLAQPASRAAFMNEIKGHVLAQGELVGTYSKQGTKTKTMNR